ncbi:MAG: flavodoxin family protein [Planctomycetia bacterium]|nr:flavodoxin family protein [Planctomycetia bacterium]
MARNILIITGSPRRNGNSDLLAKAFAEGAKEAGHKVKFFSASKDAVLPCQACDKCWKKGNACVFDDGFRKLEKLLPEADTLVFATPLYWFAFSAQLKAAIDKLYAFVNEKCPTPLKVRETFLIVSAETDEKKDFGGVQKTYKSILQYMKWKNLGELYACELGPKGSVSQEYLDVAKQAGFDLYQ